MKVSTRIVYGFGILMLLTLGALAVELSAIHQMQAINAELAEVNFHSASDALQMIQFANIIEEFSKKYFVPRGDPFYEREVEDERKTFLDHLASLQKTVRSVKEKAAIARLSDASAKYWQLWDKYRKQPIETEYLPADLSIAVSHLQSETDRTYDAIQFSIREEAARAAEAGRQAERFAWIAGGLAAVLSIVVVFVLVRAISKPLHRLTQGTHKIAKGQFWHRIPAHGRDEFADLARDFNDMSEKLGELDQMKKDFVSHVSHDLKAPLASMRQVMHLMLQEIPGSLNDQQKDLLRLSYNSAERLAAMVGNLLDVSRMEAGSMEYDIATYDLMTMIKAIVDEFDVQARAKNIQLRIESNENAVFVECDRDRIVQVIGNLFENALKFSPSNSEIIARVERKEADSRVVLSVTDSGPGVPSAHKEKIFMKFHQVKQGKKIAGQGVGLGLAICKTIVEAHKGRIWVEDNPAGGSVFFFILQSASNEEALKCGQSA